MSDLVVNSLVSWKVDVFLEVVNYSSSFPFDDRVPTQLCE